MHYLKPLILLTLLLPAAVFSQDDEHAMPEERMQEIRAMKSAFITQRMQFTPEEAQLFWPVYNAYDKEVEEDRRARRALHREARTSGSTLSEKDANALIQKDLDARAKEVEIRRKYATRFIEQLGAVRTLDLYAAEKEFQKELLKRYRDRHDEKGQGQRPGHH